MDQQRNKNLNLKTAETKDYRVRAKRLVSECEKLVKEKVHLEDEELREKTKKLILIYNNFGSYSDDLRRRAKCVVGCWAEQEQYKLVLNLVIEDANKFAEDFPLKGNTFPLIPNSFYILEKIGQDNKDVSSFLKKIVSKMSRAYPNDKHLVKSIENLVMPQLIESS